MQFAVFFSVRTGYGAHLLSYPFPKGVELGFKAEVMNVRSRTLRLKTNH